MTTHIQTNHFNRNTCSSIHSCNYPVNQPFHCSTQNHALITLYHHAEQKKYLRMHNMPKLKTDVLQQWKTTTGSTNSNLKAQWARVCLNYTAEDWKNFTWSFSNLHVANMFSCLSDLCMIFWIVLQTQDLLIV